jgi:hypothetical protein
VSPRKNLSLNSYFPNADSLFLVANKRQEKIASETGQERRVKTLVLYFAENNMNIKRIRIFMNNPG